ncbi:MAG: hypothetical protein PHX21_04680 [bacterium]|nr:hypothetical protein [bacterium]
MKKVILFLCFCFISSNTLAVESGNTEVQRDSLVAKLKSIASSDTNTAKSEKIEGQSSKKDSLLAKLKSMSTSDSSASDSSFYKPKKKEWYDTKGSVFGENPENTIASDSGTYSEGRLDGSKAGKGNELLTGVTAGTLACVFGYAYPFVFLSGTPPDSMQENIKNKGEDYKSGFSKGYRRKKKTNALLGTTGGCVAGYFIWSVILFTGIFH